MALCASDHDVEFETVPAGLTAHKIGDKSGRPLGAISATGAIYDTLSEQARGAFEITRENSGQGMVWLREWEKIRDGD